MKYKKWEKTRISEQSFQQDFIKQSLQIKSVFCRLMKLKTLNSKPKIQKQKSRIK